MKPIRVVQHGRKPKPGQFSIERVFGVVNANLDGGIQVVERRSLFDSRGVLRRAANVLWAGMGRGAVHHVVGDVAYLMLGLIGRKTALTIHDCGRLHQVRGFRRWILRALWFSWPARLASEVTFISKEARADFLRQVGFLPARSRVIYNPVSESMSFIGGDGSESDSFLQVGTKENKNLPRVIAAIRDTGIKLIVVGSLERAKREELARDGAKVEWLGSIDDRALVDAYRRCCAVVFVSTFEGFGLPVIEGQQAGRPVLASDIPVIREVGGDGCLYVDPNSEECIRSAIMQLNANPALRAQLVTRGRANAQRFRPSVIAAEYSSLYRGLA